MAISSAINPASIARERSTTVSAAQNFITGGSPLGEGVVASAANKIVGFQRGAAAVAARPPDLQGIIQTLSTNILNNVENRVQSINQNVTRIVNGTIGDLSNNYKQRLDQIDSAGPNSILSNFLNLYKEAIGYIQFLGNKRNVKTLGDNLKALQSVFAETFNIAKIIRQTIVRIVNQLSNLPKATGGGGGLNLDINVPGGPLKRTVPGGGRNRMLKMAGIGAAGVGVGALGSQVVSGMMDPGEGNVQPAPMSEGMIPGSLLDRFNGILDKFSAAINSLGTKKPAPKQSSSSGSTAAPKEKPTPPPGGAPASGTVDISKINADTPEAKAFLATVGSTEAGSYNTIVGGQEVPELTQMTIKEVYDMAYSAPQAGTYGVLPQRFGGRKINYGASSNAAGRYQFHPDTMMSNLQAAGLKPTDIYSPENQDKLALALQVSLGGDPNKPLDEKNFRIAGSSPAWEGMRKISYAEAKKRYDTYLTKAKGSPVSAAAKPMVAPSGGQQQTAQQVAQTVSQPPAQQSSRVTVAPMDMTSPQTQSRKVGDQSIPPPAMNKGGVTVPFLSSSNNDNFLTLYSRIVYNIVDG